MTDSRWDWSKTKTLDVWPPGPEDDGEWQVPSWQSVVFPNDEDGTIHHGSRGARLPEAVIVRSEDGETAVADVFSFVLDNQYCYDAEYFLVLRLREVLAPERWRALPWGHLEPGDVFYAWDKFHWREWSRTVGDQSIMSYGGDWADLQAVVDQEHPLPSGPRPAGRASAAGLLRAIRANDLDQVRSLLAAGADPNAGLDPPGEALRGVSVDRDTSALWEAVMSGVVPIVEALLAAGAAVDAVFPWGGRMTPLHGALANRRFEMIPVLLRAGADPDAVYSGRTARQVAGEIGPEVAALFDRAGSR